ncbi:tetratricopeptide repeat protein [Pelobacter propionicus]|uniref:TPR repeat-containing protein n=1 Tax=Pelobacter propionicus (strain DSM 2379 / NBRC 103807 / OttBd1) TaxID=338966 RepID=A1AMY3_PELPD|nr:tetratricopeptide repeat protein [Pelobacter propionicus]ABK98703.1 TPR repeat-containing protein [Pelobacter propionicus DSM 2379]
MINILRFFVLMLVVSLLCGFLSGAGGDERLRRGDEYLQARQWEEAIDEYRAALSERPEWPAALERLADALMAAGKDGEAISTYERLLRLDESRGSVRYTLGVLHERGGRLKEAESQYRECLRQEPDNDDARRHLADIYVLRGNLTLATKEYRQLITRQPANPLFYFRLARVLKKNRRYGEAIKEYRRAIELAPHNAELRRELAELYCKRGMGDGAIGQYRELLRLDNRDTEARNSLISLYVKLHRYGALRQLLQEGVERFPDDPDSHFRMGLMHDFAREYQAAISEYRKALALKNDHARALKGLGKIYLKLGKTTKAKECLVAARKADPDLQEAQELLNSLRERPVVKKSRKNSRKSTLQRSTKKKYRSSRTSRRSKVSSVKSKKSKKSRKSTEVKKSKKSRKSTEVKKIGKKRNSGSSGAKR